MSQTANNSLLPKGWVWMKLGEVLDFVKGKKPKNLGTKNEYLRIPYINIKAFEDKIFYQFTDGNGCPLCEQNDILIVWDGARCGLVGRGVAGAIGSTLAKLVCYELSPSYLFSFLQLNYDYINKRPRGVGIPHVEPNIFWNISIPLPPPAEQHRIVARIEELFTELDAGVEELRKAKAQLRRYRQAVLKHAFEGKLTEEWRKENIVKMEPASVLLERIKKDVGATLAVARNRNKRAGASPAPTNDLPQLPEGWVWTRVDLCSDLITKGESPNWQGFKYVDEGIPFVRSENVLWGSINLSNTVKISEEFHKKLKRSQIRAGDVLVNLVGASIGRCCVVPSIVLSANINQAVALIRLNHTLIPSYLKHLLLSPQFQKNIHSKKVETARPNISLEDMRQLVVPLPPLPEQHKIVEEIERRLSVAEEVEKAIGQGLRQAERLRQSILKRAFEGKLVPQDPSDEPASVLLERIRLQRQQTEQHIKPKRKRAGG